MSSKINCRTFSVLLLISIFSVLFSCVSRKRIVYMQDVPDSSSYKVKEFPYTEPLIQADDILSITIQTIDPQTNIALNSATNAMPSVGASSASPIGSQIITGFIVDKEGYVEMPMIGRVKLGGYSTFKARDIIREKASLYFKNPTVLVRYANFKITVLGEVVKPGTYAVPNEKVSILDVLGLAGDLTIYGNRDNVLLIREVDGVKEFSRINLKSTDLFKSPYYYLKQNDIIYIEPNSAKAAVNNSARTQLFAIIASTLSFLVIFIRYGVN